MATEGIIPITAMKRRFPVYSAFLRRNKEVVLESCSRRGMSAEKMQAVHTVFETLEQQQVLQREVELLSQQPKFKGRPTPDQLAELQGRKAALQLKQAELDSFLTNARLIEVFSTPNSLDPSVPSGESAEQNVVVHRWGTPRAFSFTPLAHDVVGTKLGILDLQAATELSGAAFVLLRGPGEQLERALINFMLDLHTAQGYETVSPPHLVRPETMFGTGQLPAFADQLYFTGEHLAIPTAEVPLTNMLMGKVLLANQLPMRLTAYTRCFRSEAGAAGVGTSGMIRVHEFGKVELVKAAMPETSLAELEGLTKDAEQVLELLDLPYQRVSLCSGDMGYGSAKTYDLEVWLPSQNKYREISSCSDCGPHQALRMDARFKRAADAKPEFVHTLNGSGVAVGRTVVAILDNNQQEDGSVTIPEVLQPYMGGQTVILPADKRPKHFVPPMIRAVLERRGE